MSSEVKTDRLLVLGTISTISGALQKMWLQDTNKEVNPSGILFQGVTLNFETADSSIQILRKFLQILTAGLNIAARG